MINDVSRINNGTDGLSFQHLTSSCVPIYLQSSMMTMCVFFVSFIFFLVLTMGDFFGQLFIQMLSASLCTHVRMEQPTTAFSYSVM
jgi:hypothetical protein